MQRKIALKVIYKTISDNSYTNLLMRKELEKLPKENRSFVTNLIQGVLKNYDYLMYQHKDLYEKANLKIKLIFSLATYEKFFLEKEDYIVNNEYTNLGENEYEKAFINAVLHKINELKEPNDEWIKESIPKWIYQLILKQYSEEDRKIILENYKRIPKTYYHLNNNYDYSILNGLDIQKVNDDMFISKDNLLSTSEFNKGYFYIQDINASSLIEEFDFDSNDLFLDACSAPGSKLFNALKYINDSNAYANDINETRVKLIKDKAELLGYKNVHYSCIDSTMLDKEFSIQFDKILLDVPCSGLGVIGRRPDIKFHIKPESLDELEEIQRNILNSAKNIIKDNGYILYSTCTLNKKENSKQIDRFLKENLDYVLIREKTILNLEGDMFYLALLKKV